MSTDANHAGGSTRRKFYGGRFIAIPYDAYGCGLLARMDRSTLLTYIGQCAAADFETGNKVTVGVSSIAKATKLSTRSVERARLKIVAMGLSRRVKLGGGLHITSEYQMLNPGIGDGVSGDQTPTDHTTKPRQIATRTPTQLCRGNNMETKGDNSISAAAVFFKGEGTEAPEPNPLREALAARGISGPKLDKLARMEGLTPTFIAKLAERTVRASNPAGLLVRLIEQEGPSLIAEAERKRLNAKRQAEAERERVKQQRADVEKLKQQAIEAEARRKQDRAREQEEQRLAEERWRAAEAVFDAMSDAERDALKTRAMRAHNGDPASTLWGLRPQHQLIRPTLIRHLAGELAPQAGAEPSAEKAVPDSQT